MSMQDNIEEFIASFNKVQESAHDNACIKGFWDNRRLLEAVAAAHSDLGLHSFAVNSTALAALALVTSEISEAAEAIRHGNKPDDKIPQFSGAEAELADAIIRIMDLAGGMGWNVAEAIAAKVSFNSTRPRLHGKQM